MVVARKAAVLAAVVVAALCVALDAGAATLEPSFSMTPVTGCHGETTVTLTLNAQDLPGARPLDLMYVLDESGSIAPTDFNAVKSSLFGWANGVTFGPSDTGAGIVEFSTDARLILNPTYVRQTFFNAATSLTQRGGNTNIGAGIQLATSSLMNYGRAGSQKVIVLETDGVDNVGTSQLAAIVQSAKAAGIDIFTVGVGANTDPTELQSIASSIPNVQTTYTLADYGGLAYAIERITAGFNAAATNVRFNMAPAPGWQVDTNAVSATNGSVGWGPNAVGWDEDVLHTGTTTLTYALKHTGSDGGDVAPQSFARLTWQDPAGQTQVQSFAGQTVHVSGCNQPPHADAGPDQTVQLSGSHTADVTLDGTASTDDGAPQALSYSWSEGGTVLGTGSTLSTPLGLGTHTITLTVDDGELTDTDTVQVTVVDPTPPVVTPVVSGTLGQNGWYTSDIAVSWNVSDPESDVSTSGCDPASVTQDTASASFTCAASSTGGTTTVPTGTLKRDATPPMISFTGAQATYDLTDTVGISCNATDDVSGVASTTCADVNGPAWQFGAGTVTRSVTATDEAGNVAHGTVSFTVVVTPAGLDALIGQLVSDQGVAKSLVAKVDAIASAPNAQAKAGKLGAFDDAVDAQTDKALTAANAALLKQFAAAL